MSIPPAPIVRPLPPIDTGPVGLAIVMLAGVNPAMSLLVARFAVLFASNATAVAPLGAPAVQLPALLQLVLVVPFHEVDWPGAAGASIMAAARMMLAITDEGRWRAIAGSLAREVPSQCVGLT